MKYVEIALRWSKRTLKEIKQLLTIWLFSKVGTKDFVNSDKFEARNREQIAKRSTRGPKNIIWEPL